MNTKHRVNGIAISAALAIAMPVWAQGPAPTGRHYGGFSGDSSNPGQGPMATTAPSPPAAASATPPAHQAARHAKAMHAVHRGMAQKAALAGDTTAQLNREELARIRSGVPSPAPMPPTTRQ
jgi:hypothetical protein